MTIEIYRCKAFAAHSKIHAIVFELNKLS